ncbi:macrolide family glycosyltransferase [Actinoplanes sp. NPDC051343]|uniref:macrolide family glycosyltransferase n=1 Tax=Actinoplanes sp. NPDC051343 TaxID=3363906 RepID=UPI0037B8A9E0
MPKHFVFMGLAERGHIFPHLGVVGELVRRGHRVTFATGASMAKAIEDAGGTPLICPSRMEEVNVRDAVTSPDVATILNLMFDDSVAMYEAITSRFDGDRPDLLAFDQFTFQPARVLDQEWKVPSVELSPSLASNEHWSYASAMIDADHAAQMDTSSFAAFYAKVVEFTTKHGMVDPEKVLMAPHRFNIVSVPREFQIAGDTFDGRFAFVGPSLATRSFLGEWTPPAGDAPLVLVSLGTVNNRQPEFFRTVVQAFTGVPWHVVITTGDGFDIGEIGPLPANVEVHRWLPHLTVLEHAAAFVTHGGMGSLMESLAIGVPVVVVPQARDGHPVAERVAELRLGEMIEPGDVTADGLRNAVVGLRNDAEVQAAVAGMKKDIVAAGGASRAADLLESYATTGEPPTV